LVQVVDLELPLGDSEDGASTDGGHRLSIDDSNEEQFWQSNESQQCDEV
jgi:hypothetical protein